ncbi:hypothetical protein SERLADRAFT_356865 [Serpula lacrymans var. lacrymans S7.9]|uniref:Protein LCHN n=1 Tax=Serpula lacrymans var. lacrymans (strain S7.9) TaxID=578457 RepID=F8P140_SERL9|nr:uncharacterized protein SERLADRAFT_356865 [Serpula lacrymans var. lacrymans S7.9]EGO22871.1 hypothetical protein SERLADRAFT_356865 [Serpula lacrymans var. lacrymans S7.9]
MDRGRVPQDITAIFHASFHPTKGNIVDWSLKASDGFNLDGVEFSTLPSGLHLVDQDVVYFTKDGHAGVCVFRRRKTTEHGQRGFRLSSLGILLVKSNRPRPWRHITALRVLVDSIYSSLEDRGILEPNDADWEPARNFFEERKVRRADLGGAGDWKGWSHELDNPDIDFSDSNPTFHLPHLLRILGPSALTLYKHVLGRRRILIFTLPPVEAACILCQAAADICYQIQVGDDSEEGTSGSYGNTLRGKCRENTNVLGMVTLSDLDKLTQEGKAGRGWIACTTDAIFLEKPYYYDLLIDLTTSTPSKASRPTFYLSKPVQSTGSRGPTHRLSSIRFTWSDVKLLDGADQCDRECCCASGGANGKSKVVSPWTDAWRIYEDVCIVCAGLWVGSWRGNSAMSYSTGNGSMANWGSVRLEGDDDLSLGGTYVRNVGMGIEGRPNPTGKGVRRSSGMSNSGGSLMSRMDRREASSSSALTSSSMPGSISAKDLSSDERRERQVLTTMAILQAFHTNTCFQLSRLASFLPPSGPDEPVASPSSSSEIKVVYLAPKDVVSFELGPLSSLDARYLEWLGDEYGGRTRVIVKRGWKDLFGVIFGFG